MTTTNNPAFVSKPDAGFRLGQVRSFWDAIVNANGFSSAYGIAAAGTTQATATQLTAVLNEVDTVGASSGVCLPSSRGSRTTNFSFCIVIHNGVSSLTVYAAVPASGVTADTIDGVAGATGITQTAGSTVLYCSAKGGAWFALGSGSNASFGALTATTFNGNTINTGTDTVAMLAQNNAFTGADTFAQSITMTAASAGLVLKRGSNGKVGQVTLTGTTQVTVSNTSIQTSDAIAISLSVVGGTVGAVPSIKTITAATGFTVAGSVGDTSTYNYAVISNAN